LDRIRIGLICISQETNDFNPVPTTLDDFAAYGILEGGALMRAASAERSVGGYFDAVAASGLAVETVPIIRANAVAGGRITREAFDFFASRIAAGLRAAGRLDGLALQLHGACAADGEDDVEGAQIALCREILGPGVPIVLALDHHANITARIVRHADAIVGHRTQPHLPRETGRIAAELLFRVVRREVAPVVAWRKIPMLSHQEQFLTDRPPMKTWFDRARAMEADPRVLQASPFPMQPWLDVSEGGWAVTVTTDGDRVLAERLADELADLAWSLRAEFQRQTAVAVDEAVRRADAAPRGMVCLSDTGDTVFGGAAGDSNVILEAMLRLGIRSRAVIPLISPATVARLAAAGEGAEVTLPVGGDQTAFFRPLTVTGRVRRVSPGPVKAVLGELGQVDMGRVAVLDVGSVTLLVTERRGVAGNMPDAYAACGVDLAPYKIAVLKTASNFQYFAPLTAEVIRVDSPGPGQSDLHRLPWRRQPRPVYPLDPLADRRRAAEPARQA
jgi:microcystin degradation protein MlrC